VINDDYKNDKYYNDKQKNILSKFQLKAGYKIGLLN